MSDTAKTATEVNEQFRSASNALLLEHLFMIECTPLERKTKDFLRDVTITSSQSTGKCSKSIAEIAKSIGISSRQAQRIARNVVQRGILGRQDQPGRPSWFWLRSDALYDTARAASGETPNPAGTNNVLARVTGRVGGDGVGRGDSTTSQGQCQLTNDSDERVLLREKNQARLFEILDIDQERLRNKEKQGASVAERRYEEAGRPQEPGQLVEFLDRTIEFLKSVDIRYPRVFLLRLRQIRRGDFVPRRFVEFNESQQTSPETWRDIAGLRDKLRPVIACLWESFTRGMDDIPFHERVQHFLSELEVRNIRLESHERAALQHPLAPLSQPCTGNESNNSIQHDSVSEVEHASRSNAVSAGQRARNSPPSKDGFGSSA